MLSDLPPAVLALADGSVFLGYSIGASGRTLGEVVFNTSLTGYQEILTDPSYKSQIVMLTYPHIGNTGVNQEDIESVQVYASGLVVKNLSMVASNFRMQMSLSEYLVRENVVAIAGIDTRKLTRHLRQKGALNACIVGLERGTPLIDQDVASALEQARGMPSMSGLDLAKEVSCSQRQSWDETQWVMGQGYGKQTQPSVHVVALDFGIKRNILRMLASRGCRITVVPAQTSAQQILELGADGVFLSNGPGDPEPCTYAIEATRLLLEARVPIFGICLGHQILALASGAKTFKMKFGHHGANHPVKDLETGKVCITSQNHGFAVDRDSLPPHVRVTHVSLFDGTLQGIARTDRMAFSFQGHPESSPGPQDMAYLFDRFIGLIHQHLKEENHAQAD